MAVQKVFDKQFKVENGIARISETIEKEFTVEELYQEKQQYANRMRQLITQMQNLNAQYLELESATMEIDNMLSAFPKIEFPSIPSTPNVAPISKV